MSMPMPLRRVLPSRSPQSIPSPVASPAVPPRPLVSAWLAGALLFSLLAVLTVPASPAAAQDLERAVQGPEADWLTLRTEHYRIHYPRASEAWARHAAARMEAIRERVAQEVGFAPEEVLDVVVSDPVSAANGFVLPVLGWPRMVLWTTPPGADSVIGHYRDWAELLVVHEDVHVVHLLRPSRNPLRRALATVLPLGPVAGVPRWVTEGYATVLEGRLTAAGRPHSDLRAAVLRRWAQEGKLPSYGRLASDQGSYLGTSMAYLAGSAYLEWLEERAGEGSLRDLWARLTARQARDFDTAFRGVFGDSPGDLWDRFTAELTWRALEVERRVAGEPVPPGWAGPSAAGAVEEPPAPRAPGDWVEGDLWLDLAWQTGAPALSPDGGKLALVLRHREDPPELAVYSTSVDEEAVEERAERRRRIADEDPEDVPAVEVEPPPRRRLHTLPTLDGAAPSQPRWLPTVPGEADALLLVRFLPDADGFLLPDLFRWTPERGELVRLTRGAALRDPDPSPAGPVGGADWAVAVRHRHGLSQLVRVELGGAEAGRIRELTEPSLEVVHDSPRISPDGTRLAYVRNAGGPSGWRLVVRDLLEGGTALGPERELPLPPRATVHSPAWGPAPPEGGDGTRGARADAEDDGAAGTTGAPDGGAARPPEAAAAEAALYAVVGSEGFLDVFAFREAGGEWTPRRVTRTRGGALAPTLPAVAAGTGDAETAAEPASPALFFLSLEPDGLDLRRLPLAAAAATPAAAEPFGAPAPVEGMAPAVRPPAPPRPLPFAVADLPAAEPYGLGPRQELFVLTGGAWGAAGSSAEVGLRSGDLLGRLEVVATGAWGEEAGVEGGSLAAAWRRLPVDLSLHLFSARERPSRQDAGDFGGVGTGPEAGLPFDPLAVPLLDVQRQGAEVAARWERLAGGGPLELGGGLYAGTVDPAAGRSAGGEVDESSLFAAARWHPATSRGEWRAGLSLAARGDAGETDGDGWTRFRGRAAVRAGLGDHRLELSWEQGRTSGDAVDGALPGVVPGAPWQLFQVGGLPSSVLPSSVAAARVPVPALPAAVLVGERFEAQRVEATAGFIPLPLFWSRYRVESSGVESEWRSLAGVEWAGDLGPVPLLRLPELRLTLGAARLLDGHGDRDGDWEGWAALTWSP